MAVLGIDIGALTCRAFRMEGEGRPAEFWEERHGCRPYEAVRRLLELVFTSEGPQRLKIGVTGVGRTILSARAGSHAVNDIIALAFGAGRLHPAARTVIEIGGQSSRWLLLEPGASPRSDPVIADFAVNEACAAGSGAFLEQQAARLAMGIEGLSALAEAAPRGATIAGRCSVFAKSDMIHLQQKGTPAGEIAYGLYLALARNFAAAVVRGRGCPAPVLFAGGAAKSPALIRAFREVLGLGDDGIILPDRPGFVAAAGAAAAAAVHGPETVFASTDEILALVRPEPRPGAASGRPLGSLDVRPRPEPSAPQGKRARGFLGVDVGSISTCFALVGDGGEVLAGSYVPTAGYPIDALRRGWRRLEEACPGGLEIEGIGTTGSGRHLAGRLLGADVIHNEITCQLKSAAAAVPDVDTVFEIGGQDAKFIAVDGPGGGIRDFTMNKVCAAGTGAFLEEQAGLLGIRIEDDFAALAAGSAAPRDLGSRCTVFMESEVAAALGRGAPIEDVAAGLARAVARGYLEKVAAGRRVGRTVVFQGGVASNPAVVRALEMELGRPVRVHPHNRISGAVGAALLAMEAHGGAGGKGRDRASSTGGDVGALLGRNCSVSSFTCTQCPNRCQVNRIAVGAETIFFGDACERHTARLGAGGPERSHQGPSGPGAEDGARGPDLFARREGLIAQLPRGPARPAVRIGLPRASFLVEGLPFWTSFWTALGARVEVSPISNPETFEAGATLLPAETCLPIKLAFGHILRLAEGGVDRVFVPSIVDRHLDPGDPVQLCPYAEHLPYMARSAADLPIVSPCVRLNEGPAAFLKSMRGVSETLGLRPGDIQAAFETATAAQARFEAETWLWGETAVTEFGRAGREFWAVLGRPYMLHDPFLNLGLARHLERLGITAVPMDALPVETRGAGGAPGDPPWRYSRAILDAAAWCGGPNGAPALVLTSFGCGLDAFNLRDVIHRLGDRPHLVLEFDEHRGEAGLITRLEAFADEVRHRSGGRRERTMRPSRRLENRPRANRSTTLMRSSRLPGPPDIGRFRDRRFVLPYFADHAHAFSGALRSVGLEARVLPPPDAESAALGERHTSGKECHAYALIAGDFIKLAAQAREAKAVYYFPGAKYVCVLAQYGDSLNALARGLGFEGLEALAPPFENLAGLLGLRGLELLWSGLVGIDLLLRGACAARPYELRPGETDRVHGVNLLELESGLAAGNPGHALERAAERLRSIAVRREKRPLVGIAGDIYTRQNASANRDLLHRLEALGCEVSPAPFFIDEVDFSLRRTLDRRLRELRIADGAATGLLYLRKEYRRLQVRRRMGGAGGRGWALPFREIIRLTSPYLGPDNNSALLLNVAQMADFAQRGADGVVNAICFNCMLGTVSGAVAARVRRDYGGIPIPTMVYAGAETPAERTKLEAFVYQVRQFAAARRGSAITSPVS